MKSPPAHQFSKWCRRLLLWAAILVALPFTLLACFQSKLIYFPRPYGPHTTAEWATNTSGRPINFITGQGQQRAFLQGNLAAPRNLWIVCGGNGSLALDWSDWLVEHAPAEDAYLLVDFPGYGDCSGRPSPEAIRESFLTAIPAAAELFSWPSPADSTRLRIFGHSLGAAACLMAASDFSIQRGVLIAPFTSTMDMSRAMTGLPLGFLVHHRFDNAARLAQIAARGASRIIILHGTGDEAIPISMSRKLAVDHQSIVQLVEIPDGRHNTLPHTHTGEIAAAMAQIGRRP